MNQAGSLPVETRMNRPFEQFVGVDGCRGGWVSFRLKKEGEALAVFAPSLDDLYRELGGGLWLVDMPMGLPMVEQWPRQCDAQARKMLSGQASSIFTVLPREIYQQHQDYQEALTLAKALLGKGFSKQAWFLRKKILEVDGWAQIQLANEAMQVCEAHPELIFRLLKGERLASKKASAEGFAERAAVLEKCFPGAQPLLENCLRKTAKTTAKPDDWADALALAVYAWQKQGSLSPHPQPVMHDEMGLPMAIWW